MTSANPAPVLDLIDAFRRSKAMFTAVSLGVFDLLHEGPAGAAALAEKTGTQTDALARLLDACVGLGFLGKQNGIYTNTPAAEVYLRRQSPQTLAGYILYSDQVLFRLWANLGDAIREGTHRWRQTFGLDAGSLFDHFFRSDEAMRTFLAGMHGFGLLSSPSVAAAFDLGRFRRMADLGGATGHLVTAACERYGDLRGVVFDLPRVIEVAREHVSQSPARDRIELLSGDFFQGDLPDADLYALGRILHDWSEEKIHRLLARIYERLPAGGALLVAERLLEEDKSGPTPAHLQSLNMLCCTEGKERTLSEYAALLHHAGFARVEGRRTGAPLDAVLAVKN
ncbi:MAG TPA: class I SAM-dependent methyltransferase [Bryobacteraceae bacterium]|nr:class I SAM-dependent methyltransferase [Bryobacteraceae bacterium]